MIAEEPQEACAGTSSAVTSFDDDSSDMYVEEVTSKKVGRKPKDRRFYSREKHLTPKQKFFRNKMKNINETVSENIKKFQKCDRFDSTVSKINSVSDSSRTSEILQEATVVKPPRKQGEQKTRYILTGNIGEKPSFFDDDLKSFSDISSVPDDPATVKLTTKSKIVLHFTRYKLYNESLKGARDWGSERKTYSRSKAQKTYSRSKAQKTYSRSKAEGEDPNTSHNSTITSLLSSKSFEIQDVYQMRSTPDLSNVSLDAEGIAKTSLKEIKAEPTVTAKEVSQYILGVDKDKDIIAGTSREFIPMCSSEIIGNESYLKYSCGLCPYSSNIKVHVKNHRMRHTGERPFHCPLCKKVFITAHQQHSHLKICQKLNSFSDKYLK